MALEITDAVFKEEVIDSQQDVLVDFYADWCGPCKMMAPVIEGLDVHYSGRIKFTKVNVDENPAAADAYKVMSIPTFILFRNGTPSEPVVGVVSKEKLMELIDG